MELVSFDPAFGQFRVSDFDPFFDRLIRRAGHASPGLHFFCVAGQLDDDLESFQRLALPVARDVAEQTMLDPVPFAGSRRIVADFESHAGFVGETLEFEFPQSAAGAVAAAAVSGDQQASCARVSFASELLPPAPNAGDGKLSGVVTDPHQNACLAGSNVVYAAGNGFSFFGVWKVVPVYFQRPPLRAIGFPRSFQVSERYLLFRVDRNRRVVPVLSGPHPAADVFKPGITIGVLFSFTCLAVRLQAVSELLQDAAHRRRPRSSSTSTRSTSSFESNEPLRIRHRRSMSNSRKSVHTGFRTRFDARPEFCSGSNTPSAVNR
ncbi:MAG: hypothetical protein R3C19_08570 [Planctomycetaceae bacterium]